MISRSSLETAANVYKCWLHSRAVPSEQSFASQTSSRDRHYHCPHFTNRESHQLAATAQAQSGWSEPWGQAVVCSAELFFLYPETGGKGICATGGPLGKSQRGGNYRLGIWMANQAPDLSLHDSTIDWVKMEILIRSFFWTMMWTLSKDGRRVFVIKKADGWQNGAVINKESGQGVGG